MKRLVRILAGLVGLLVVLALGALLFLDPLVAAAIEKGATFATGVETDVGSVDASPFAGTFEMQELSLANPPGFRAEPFLRVASARAAWQNGTILSDTIEMDELVLEGVQVSLEKGGSGTNWGAILDHLEGLSPKDTPAGSTPAKKLAIKKIEILNVTAGLHLSGVPLLAGSTEVKVPRIVIEDFRSDGSTTETLAKLTRAVLQAILENVLSVGKDIFPADVVKDLGQGLSGLKDVLGSGAESLIKGVGGVLEDVGGILKPK